MYESPLSPWFIEREVKSKGEKLLAAIFCSPFFLLDQSEKARKEGDLSSCRRRYQNFQTSKSSVCYNFQSVENSS